MPTRGRRIAARQAQLGQKRKKGRGPSGMPSMPDPEMEEHGLPSSIPETATFAGQPATPRRTETRPAAYRYVGSELRRVLLVTCVIIIVLVALSFILD